MRNSITLAGAIALVFAASALPAQQPAQPPVTKSPAASLGISVYPAKGQTPERQANDEQECYAWAQQQTGVDPTAKANTDSAAASKAKMDSATTGAAVGGAARGAVAGVAIGAVAGDAGTGAAVGATAGAIFVNDRKVGEGRIDRATPNTFAAEGADVGMDLGTPVTEDYTSHQSRLNGRIHQVKIELK